MPRASPIGDHAKKKKAQIFFFFASRPLSPLQPPLAMMVHRRP
jgi:hypothetical protein